MARPRKKAGDMTTEEAMKRLFPKKVIDAAKAEIEASKEKRKPS
jgi:hypothetical protein